MNVCVFSCSHLRLGASQFVAVCPGFSMLIHLHAQNTKNQYSDKYLFSHEITYAF